MVLDSMDAPRAAASSSGASVLVLALSILGILATSLLLLGYYFFITKCCLNWRRAAVAPPPRRYRIEPMPDYSTAVEGRGLGEAVIRQIPTFRYHKGAHVTVQRPLHECAVCLYEFQEEERVRLLPDCLHVFHIDCIDTWLQANANCPLCRSAISACPIHLEHVLYPAGDQERREDVVIDVGDRGIGRDQEQAARKLHKISSMGEECIDAARDKEGGLFSVQQPMRRSLSMDSCSDRHFYLALQNILQRQNPSLLPEDGKGESSGGGGGGGGGRSARFRRSLLFSFSQSRRSRSAAVLPI